MTTGPHGYPAQVCPRCGMVVEGYGPATLMVLMAAHFRDLHPGEDFVSGVRNLQDAADRLRAASARLAAVTQGVRLPEDDDAQTGPFPAQSRPLDDAFFDGARLTPFDAGFLRSLRVCWNMPRNYVDGGSVPW